MNTPTINPLVRFLTFGVTALLLIAVSPLAAANASGPKKVIFDTDMCLDVDDVGALAMLHAMADLGEVEILAITFNETHKDAAAAIDAINTWYGRGDIPIGIYKGKLEDPDNSKYLGPLAKFPNDLTNNEAPTALKVYSDVLAAQSDKSVTIISVGFLNNLHDLLKADPELVKSKVAELTVMAGVRNDGFNLVRHGLVSQSEYVIHNWPTPLVVSQFGHRTLTGTTLIESPKSNPVREAYFKWFDDSFKGRSSWDQVTVLYGVRGTKRYFKHVTDGKGRLRNGYEWKLAPGHRTYLDPLISNEEFERIIEDLMVRPPSFQKPQ